MEFNLNALLLTIHLLAAAAWFGAGWYDRLIVSPSIKASGAAGVEHVRQHMAKGGGGRWFAPASILTILSGALLYWRLGINMATLSGLFITVGAALGVASLVLGITVHRPAENRIKQALESADDQQILTLVAKLEHHTTFSAWLVSAAFLLMALRSVII